MIKVSALIKEVERADVVYLWSKELNAYLEVDLNHLKDAIYDYNPIFELALVISENEDEEEDPNERVIYLDPDGVNPDSKL